MSIYDKASLVHIPSGVNSGTLYNVLPNNSDGDFEFERGSTATRVNKDGLIETVGDDTPRLDYPLLDGVVQDCPNLLLEPEKTNLLTYSEDFTNWSDTGVTVTANDITSPDGSQTADKLESTGNNWRRSKFFTAVSGTTYTYSIFAKLDTTTTTTTTQVEIYKGASGIAVDFNLSNKNISGSGLTDAFIEEYPNDWYRIGGTYTANGTSNILYVYPSAGYSTSGTMYFWGAQVEVGSYKTSYIPTSGSTETRSADVCNGAEATFNDSEGVLFAESAALTLSDGSRDIEISDGNTNRVIIQYNPSGVLQVYVIVNGVPTYTFAYTTLITQFKKIALKYKENDFALWVDGFEADSSNSGSVFGANTLTQLDFLKAVNSSLNFYGKTKQLMTFNEALSDTELEDLTSWDSFNEMATEQLYTIE
jgi:hypothetical protein